MAIKQHRAFPRERGNNITLIGMPGSGKSTMAKVTAKFMQREKIDTDRILCEQNGVNHVGEFAAKSSFRTYVDAEEKAVLSIPSTTSKNIIATGGSVIYSGKSMHYLQRLGVVIYIEVPYEIIASRIGSLEKRGVLLRSDQSLEDLYWSRHRLYKRYSDMEFRPGDLDVGSSAKLLAALIEFLEAERVKYNA